MIARRHLLLGAAAASLSGCKIFDNATGDSALHRLFASAEDLTLASQRALGRNALARTYPESDIRQGQRPNGSTDPTSADYLDLAANNFTDYRLEIKGMVENPQSLSLADLRALPSQSQITRHDCVEGWSCIAKWTGTPLAAVLSAAKPLPAARYCVFDCFDAIEKSLSGEVFYYESIDLIDAFHPQTLLAYQMNNAPLPTANGAPLRLRVERHLGYKHAKYLKSITLTDSLAAYGKGSYWADRGYEWYAGI